MKIKYCSSGQLVESKSRSFSFLKVIENWNFIADPVRDVVVRATHFRVPFFIFTDDHPFPRMSVRDSLISLPSNVARKVDLLPWIWMRSAKTALNWRKVNGMESDLLPGFPWAILRRMQNLTIFTVSSFSEWGMSTWVNNRFWFLSLK